MHGDLWKNWRCYQEAPVNDMNFRRRDQSKEFNVVLAAHRKIARYFGRGPTIRADPDTFNLDQLGRLLALKLRTEGHGAEVNAILDGLS